MQRLSVISTFWKANKLSTKHKKVQTHAPQISSKYELCSQKNTYGAIVGWLWHSVLRLTRDQNFERHAIIIPFKMHCDHHFRSFSSTPKIKTSSSCPFSVQVLITETQQTKSTPASTSWESYIHLHSLLVDLIPIFPGYIATITLAQGVHALPELFRTE